MQKAMIIDCDRLFAANYRCTRVNQFSPNLTRVNSDYLKCLKRSRKLLKGLEHSLVKTRQYEDALARCRRDHDCRRHHSGKAADGTTTADDNTLGRPSMSIVKVTRSNEYLLENIRMKTKIGMFTID